MSFYRNKGFWVITTLLAPILLLAIHHGIETMTSTYKKDFGNGVVKYADDYVNSGLWMFDCKYARLISRHPLRFPTADLAQAKTLTIGSMYTLSKADQELAKSVIRATTMTPGWYENLRYVYSGVSEYSEISAHVFDLLTEYEGQAWALRIRQILLPKNGSNFKLTAQPYDPESYVGYEKALQDAAKSCPAPQ